MNAAAPPRTPETLRPQWAPLLQIALVCSGLAISSLLFNITSSEEMGGGLLVWSFIRKSVTFTLNAGMLWALLAVFAGWMMPSFWSAVGLGILAPAATLFLHYGLGMLLGIYPWSMLAENSAWFIAAGVLCGPLGAVGRMLAQGRKLGSALGHGVALGLMAEPLMRGFPVFSGPGLIPWPERYATVVSGLVEAGLGVVLIVMIRRRSLRREPDGAQKESLSPPVS